MSKKNHHKPDIGDNAVTPLKKRFTITERDMGIKQSHILEYHVFAPEGSTIEDLASPDCWTHVAHKLQPMAQITVTEATGKWVALLYVVSCTRLSAVTEVIWCHEVKANAELPTTDNFEVRWINYQEKFGVLRKSDNVWVARNLPTSIAAAAVLSAEMQAYKQA